MWLIKQLAFNSLCCWAILRSNYRCSLFLAPATLITIDWLLVPPLNLSFLTPFSVSLHIPTCHPFFSFAKSLDTDLFSPLLKSLFCCPRINIIYFFGLLIDLLAPFILILWFLSRCSWPYIFLSNQSVTSALHFFPLSFSARTNTLLLPNSWLLRVPHYEKNRPALTNLF